MADLVPALLVRHGQSEWNALGRWQGQADPPLSDLGRRQARHGASRLVDVLGALPAAVVSSDLRRALDTAEALVDGTRARLVVDPGLRERDAGEWSGLSRAEIDRDWPGYLVDTPDEHRGMGPTTGTPRRPPGWEPDDALRARAVAALVRARARAGEGPLLVVTHGGLIYALEAALGAPHARLANLAGRWFDLGPQGPVALGPRVHLVGADETSIPDQI